LLGRARHPEALNAGKGHGLVGKLRRLALQGRTVRLRFTVLYAVVFLVSAIGLLALTNLLVGVEVTQPAPGQQAPAPQTGLAAAEDRIHELETKLSNIRAAQSRQFLTGSAIALAAMAAVSVLLGNAVAGRVLRPLRTITAATRRISAENLHERLAVPGPTDEVKELADTIDGLLERLDASFAAQRRFVANASHELRTPLATMRASLDVAMGKPEPAPPAMFSLADRLRIELDRIDRLLAGLLVLARAQHGALIDRTHVSLSDLVSGALTARATEIAARSLTIAADIREAAWTQGSPVLLSRVADNLIDNAIIHNQEGGWVRIATTTADASVQLVVETGGPMLDPGRVARLAEPFQRLAADRTRSDTGSGLGLSIVAAIVDAHAGRIDLHARTEGGLRVTVSLPAVPTPQGSVA
jgi:signal transduction histidine kinase